MKRKTSSTSLVQAVDRLTDAAVDLTPHVTFESGAKRSGLSTRFDLLPYNGMVRVAQRYELGLTKYTRDNWKKGLKDPVFIDQLKCHIADHMLKYFYDVEPDDDHLAAIVWGALTLMEAERVRNKKVQS